MEEDNKSGDDCKIIQMDTTSPEWASMMERIQQAKLRKANGKIEEETPVYLRASTYNKWGE
jgi:hypothetical protein